ncbi:MAG: diphosphate--fructose-6-phosphate 1-phosphotransferase [Verrucomicrobia bacterium]|nr:diphosphate--fructose-6-phosphate 1-phosphotransferase [Verrucomicrobiota bacterium]
MNRQMSRLQKLRAEYRPGLPKILRNLHHVRFEKGGPTSSVADQEDIRKEFPQTFGRPILNGKEGEVRKCSALKVGVVFSGGQAAGGHNVISGLFDALKILNPESSLMGFLGGPSGIVENRTIEITQEVIAPYRNQGGFDLIGSGRTKIETEEQLAASLKTAQAHALDGLVVVGGDDSNTNAAILAEFFLKHGCKTAVIGVPKTIDGDLKNDYIPISFGFDTAAKTYSEMIGNIERDALSAKKYYHFIKLMGRSASHITLECALASHPNVALIGEEVAAKKMTLAEVTKELTDVIEKRAKKGKNYGVILVPEGLIEFIPEVKTLIAELNNLVAKGEDEHKLTGEAKSCFQSLPEEIQKQLLLDRDPHGNVQVSQIETEKMLISAVKKELALRGSKAKFSALSHFFGYEGRAGFPSNFDTRYCYALGHTAALLVEEKMTGYITCVGDLHRPIENWTIAGLPLTMLMNMEMRKGKKKPVIQKALVNLKGKAFEFFRQNRAGWALEDAYRYPGPIQYFGETDLVDIVPISMQLELS